MPFVRALLLYIAAAGAGEALLAGAPGAAGLQSPPHAVLPGYQIVLPFPASGAAPAAAASQYSAPPPHFQSALFSPFPRTSYSYSTASPVHPFDATPAAPAIHSFVSVAAAPLIDNYVEADARSAGAYSLQTPVARSQHPHASPTFYSQSNDLSDLGRVAHYQDQTYANGVQSVQSQSHPLSLGRSRHFQNSISSQAVPTAADLSDSRFQSHSPSSRQYQVGQTTAEFGTNSFQGSRQGAEISDRHFQTNQQPIDQHDYRVGRFPQHQQIIDNQQYQSPRVDETFTARSLISENFGSYRFPYSDPNERNSLLIPEARRRIQQDRFNIQRANAFRNAESESLQAQYLQSNTLALPLRHDIQVIASTPAATQARSSLESVQPSQGIHQSYRVDVEGNGYGYRYAVQSSHNPEVPDRQPESIVPITPPSLHVH